MSASSHPSEDRAREVCVVTGATSGIGRCVASTLAASGRQVLALGRNAQILNEMEAQHGGSLRGRAIDLLVDEELDALAHDITREYAAVSVLVHCAGIYQAGALSTTSADVLDSMYFTNVRAPFRLTNLLIPLLERAKGNLVFVNSSAGLSVRAGAGIYSATQFAVRALADGWRAELNERGIRVLSIYPGRTATPRIAKLFAAEGRSYEPALLLQPRDIADVILMALNLPHTAELTEVSLRPAQKSY